jgi:hypothetical protein
VWSWLELSGPHTQVDNHAAQPPVRCLDLDLRPNGWTDCVRLSGCTFGDVISLCARSVWKRYTDGAEREFLATPAMHGIKDQPVQGLELTLYEDGSLKRVSLSGCTVEQALQFCRFMVQFDALADNNWLNPDEEQDD